MNSDDQNHDRSSCDYKFLQMKGDGIATSQTDAKADKANSHLTDRQTDSGLTMPVYCWIKKA